MTTYPELTDEFIEITEQFKKRGILVSCFEYNGFIIEFRNKEYHDKEHKER